MMFYYENEDWKAQDMLRHYEKGAENGTKKGSI